MSSRNREWINHAEIKVGGQPLSQEFLDRLLELVVDTTLDLPAMFTMRFMDDNIEWVDEGPFEPGDPVEIFLGHGSEGLHRVIAGEITGLEPEFTDDLRVHLVVRGYDRSHRLNRGTKSRVFIQKTDSDIVQEIGGAANLQVEASRTSQVYEHVFQHNQTDLEFLHSRARHLGFEVFVDDRKLYFRPPQGNRGAVALDWGDTLRTFNPRLTLAGQVDEVIVKGWDPVKKKEVVGQASRSNSAPRVNVGGTGGSMASNAFSSARQMIVRQPVRSQSEADALAQAVLDEINATFVEAEGIAIGDPQLVAGNKLEIAGVGDRFSGTYLVTSAVHIYVKETYEVHFRVEGARPKLMADLVADAHTTDGVSNQWGGVVPAIVTNNNDEQNMGRVKLKFPWLNGDLESDWARVVAPGAGNERGFYILPEVNDEVLVAFEQGDFNRPYVVGGLWNGKDKPPEQISAAVQNGKVETRTWKTRAGHVIRLTDKSGQEKIEIIDSSGSNSIVIDGANKKITIESAGEVSIKTKGNGSIEADGNLTIKGKGNVNVEATGQLVLKGSMVNIN